MNISDLKPYGEMKSSSVEWIDSMPTHWREVRAKQIFRKRERPVRNSDEVVTCFRDGTVTLRKNRRTQGFTESLKEQGYQGIRSGDLVIHAMDAFAGAIGISDSDGKSTSVYSVCTPRQQDVSPEYFAFLIRQMARSEWILALSKGIRERSSDFRYSIFGAETLPMPPFAEQTAIVRFLDHADRRIQRYIRTKQKLIALLEEQKQVIIHRVVTGGVDVQTEQPYPAYKHSNVEWLGSVPRHWEVTALYHRYWQCLGKMLDTKKITGSHLLPYLRNVDVQWDQINTTDLPTMDIPPAEYSRYTVRQGDLLLCEGGEVGRAALWAGELRVCGFQKALHRLRPRNANQDAPRFLYYALRAAVQCNAFNDGHVSTIAHLTGEKLRAHRFPFPSLIEQEKLAYFLDGVSKKIQQTVSHVQKQIGLLTEYRTCLIADVVMGKLDVREPAETLSNLEDKDAGKDLEERPRDGYKQTLDEWSAAAAQSDA